MPWCRSGHCYSTSVHCHFVILYAMPETSSFRQLEDGDLQFRHLVVVVVMHLCYITWPCGWTIKLTCFHIASDTGSHRVSTSWHSIEFPLIEPGYIHNLRQYLLCKHNQNTIFIYKYKYCMSVQFCINSYNHHLTDGQITQNHTRSYKLATNLPNCKILMICLENVLGSPVQNPCRLNIRYVLIGWLCHKQHFCF